MQMLHGMFGIFITLLNANRVMTRRELAAKFEMSMRTVSRYIDAMSADCGIPIISTYGINGGYMIADNYRLSRMFFTTKEYDRILTALAAVEKEFDDEITDSVRGKFLNLRESMEGEKYLLKNDRLVIDSSSWQNSDSYRDTIAALNRAIDSAQVATMTYVDKSGARTKRDFEPHTLVLKEGVWYVYGWCRTRCDFRLFKLSRIRELTVKSEKFETREGGDVYAKLNEEFAARTKADIEIEFDEEALPEIEEWLGIDCIEKRDGEYYASGYVYSEDLLLKKLLALGSHVRVLSPAYVAEELKTELKRALEAYAEK